MKIKEKRKKQKQVNKQNLRKNLKKHLPLGACPSGREKRKKREKKGNFSLKQSKKGFNNDKSISNVNKGA